MGLEWFRRGGKAEEHRFGHGFNSHRLQLRIEFASTWREVGNAKNSNYFLRGDIDVYT